MKLKYYTCVEAIADHYDFYSQPGNMWLVIEVVHQYMKHWKDSQHSHNVSTMHEALGLSIDEYLGTCSDESNLAELIMEKAEDYGN